MFAESFLDRLHHCGIRFIAGVPDSILQGFAGAVDRDPRFDHIIAANEGAALAMAAGHHLATGRIPLVYLQNSGLANALNPYLSMCHPSVYDLPAILLVGWRGEPNRSDEPQHRKLGSITTDLLRLLDIKIVTLAEPTPQACDDISQMLEAAVSGQSSLAIVVSKGVLDEPVSQPRDETSALALGRPEVISVLLQDMSDEDTVFGGIGHVSRELYAARLRHRAGGNDKNNSSRDFLCVGAMGHAHQIALGYARERRAGRVWCLDGDGAVLMHLGALAVISRASCPLVHVLFDNGVHGSVGGQPVCASNLDYGALAADLGFRTVHKIETHEQLERTLPTLQQVTAPVFVWIRVRPEIADDLPRPRGSFADMKRAFMA
jgi:phosphonopyruvate decarboxylase